MVSLEFFLRKLHGILNILWEKESGPMWKIIDTGVLSAEENMRQDAAFLEDLDVPTIHYYEWEVPSVTYGHFIRPSQFLNLSACENKAMQLARRPTGGGIVFHAWDFAFSVLVPATSNACSLNTLENYAFVNQAVLKTVETFLKNEGTLELTPFDAEEKDMASRHFCMARPTKYDVLFRGQKVAGAAQRKTKRGFLHQGTIALVMPKEEELKELLLPGTMVIDAMKMHTLPLLKEQATSQEMNMAKESLKQLLQKNLHEQLQGLEDHVRAS
jgi:lipoate-protein ligase A